MNIQHKALQAIHSANEFANCSNSKLCVKDASELFVKAQYKASLNRSLKSLAYSIGITSPVYQKLI